MKSILHISDIHLSENPRFGLDVETINKTLGLLFEDLKKLKAEYNVEIDSIFITGDLAYSGNKSQYDLIHSTILRPLMENLKLKSDDFYIVPGNHDVDRSKVKTLDKFVREHYDEETIGDLFNSINTNGERWERTQAYNDFIKDFYKNSDNIVKNGSLIRVHQISKNLYVICANSAWLAQDDQDKFKILYSKGQLDGILKGIPKDAKKILLAHHPLNWMEENDRSFVSSFIEKNVSLFCFGHMHEFNQLFESSFSENATLNVQAGTLDTRNDHSGYSIINLNKDNSLSNGRIIYRKYSQDESSFVAWNERGKNGVFDFTTDELIPFDTKKFSDISKDIIDDLDKDLMINVGLRDDCKKSLRSLFIEPNFEAPTFLSGYINSDENIKETSSILMSDGCFGLIGGKSSGKTYILRYLYLHLLERQVAYNFSKIGFFYDLKDSSFKNKNSILNCLFEKYSNHEYKTSFEQKLRDSVECGDAVIIIDNISIKDQRSLKSLKEFIEKYPLCRYIFSIDDSDALEVSAFLSNIDGISYSAATIGTLKRRDVRKIVEKWIPSTSLISENLVYQDVTKVVNNSQLPHNHFIYSMLLAIYEVENHLSNILSESDIIENFIEIILKKHCMDIPSDLPQYKVLLHFMGFLSKRIFHDNTFDFTTNYLYETALKFNQETLNGYDAKSYIDPLINSGVLVSNNGSYRFSQISFWYYSVSYYISHDEKLRNEILNDNNLLKYDKIVEYYSSQNASSLDVISIIKRRLDNLIHEANESLKSDNGIDALSINPCDYSQLSILDLVSDVDDLESRINHMNADRDRDDDELDRIAPLKSQTSVSHKTSSVNRAEYDSDISYFSVELRNVLSLYSRVFLNSELLMGADQIIDIFESITDGYAFYTKYLMASLDDSFIVPILLPQIEKRLERDGVTKQQKEEILDQFKAIIYIIRSALPNGVQSLMNYDISSRKPRVKNIIEIRLSREIDDLKKCYLNFLLMDIDESQINKIAKKMMSYDSEFIRKTLFFKIATLVNYNYSLSDAQRKELKNILIKLSKGRGTGLSSNLKKYSSYHFENFNNRITK